MWNTVDTMSSTPPVTDALARRAVERAVADKQSELARSMQGIVESTYALVEESGDIDPPMRQILARSGLSTQAFYRQFRSKDELMLALLDDGRRRLVGYLERRMQRASSPSAQVRAWVEGVMAQAADARAAGRTRPFVTGEVRIAELFPDDHNDSVEQLVSLLVPPLSTITSTKGNDKTAGERVHRDAEAVYRLTFATLRDHLVSRTKPTPATIDHLVRFVLRAVGATP
jgi:AcrR family transcriptional regulator